MPPFDHAALLQVLRQNVAHLPMVLSEGQLSQLIDYVGLLTKWNAVYNLTAVRDPAQMLTQHILDSLAVIPALNPGFIGAKNVLDVGAGGGLPGIVLAIWGREAQPEMQVSMIDTVSKKTAFLTQAKVELGLRNVTVHTARVEQLEVSEKFDVITSRAFAELADFVTWSGHLLAESGRFIAMKGVHPKTEIDALPRAWKVSAVQRIGVPGLQAERHLVLIERANLGDPKHIQP